jgi:glycosyltransferase involved in cell wall biosynthesis
MTLLDKSNTLVIVPAYNEQDSIVSVIEEIKATGFPFVVIDDGSIDETRSRAISAGARTISLPFNAGVGGALKCGFLFANKGGYSAVVQVDGDGQHLPESIEKLVKRANCKNTHLVVGSRFSTKGSMRDLPFFKKASINALVVTTGSLVGAKVSDPTSGFRLFTRPLIKEFSSSFPTYYLGDTFEALYVAAKFGYTVSEVPVEMRERQAGIPSSSPAVSAVLLLKALSSVFFGLHFLINKHTEGA